MGTPDWARQGRALVIGVGHTMAVSPPAFNDCPNGAYGKNFSGCCDAQQPSALSRRDPSQFGHLALSKLPAALVAGGAPPRGGWH
jgi:hypothetical protein